MTTIVVTQKKDGKRLGFKVMDGTIISIEPLWDNKGTVRLRYGLDYTDLTPDQYSLIEIFDSKGLLQNYFIQPPDCR